MYLIRQIFNFKEFIIRKNYIKNGANIGEGTYLAPNAYIDTHKPGKVTIGKNCYITRNVVILCHTDTKKGGPAGIWTDKKKGREFGDVTIGDNVFIGVNSVIMPGVKIGNNSIIGALSLVTADVPSGHIYAGIPAKFISKVEDHLKN